jgi:hypothetical protein
MSTALVVLDQGLPGGRYDRTPPPRVDIRQTISVRPGSREGLLVRLRAVTLFVIVYG